MNKPVTFWFEFASTYSYLSAMRIERQAKQRGVEVTWRPFLLGPIFASQGWDTSPFAIYPAKGKNMWRDMARRCEKYELAFNPPAPSERKNFPQHSVLAARVALIGLDAGWGRDFVRAVYTAQFADGRNIADPDVLQRLIRAEDAPAVMASAVSPDIKGRLRANTDAAIAMGLYGAPSFTVGDELFWGDDRMEDALEWATR